MTKAPMLWPKGGDDEEKALLATGKTRDKSCDSWKWSHVRKVSCMSMIVQENAPLVKFTFLMLL